MWLWWEDWRIRDTNTFEGQVGGTDKNHTQTHVLSGLLFSFTSLLKEITVLSYLGYLFHLLFRPCMSFNLFFSNLGSYIDGLGMIFIRKERGLPSPSLTQGVVLFFLGVN